MKTSMENVAMVTALLVRGITNTWIDYCFVVDDLSYLEAENVLDAAFTEWNEGNDDAEDITLCDFLSQQLTSAGIVHDIYYKREAEECV